MQGTKETKQTMKQNIMTVSDNGGCRQDNCAVVSATELYYSMSLTLFSCFGLSRLLFLYIIVMLLIGRSLAGRACSAATHGGGCRSSTRHTRCTGVFG